MHLCSCIQVVFCSGISQYLNKRLSGILKENYWSLIPDETTDRTGDSKMALVVQYFDPKEFKMKVEVLALANPKDVTASGIFLSILF